MSPSIQADNQDFEMDEKDPAERLNIDAFSGIDHFLFVFIKTLLNFKFIQKPLVMIPVLILYF